MYQTADWGYNTMFFQTKNKIDLTGYTRLSALIDIIGGATGAGYRPIIGYGSDNMAFPSIDYDGYEGLITQYTMNFDISVNDKFYISAGAYCKNVKYYQIWLS